MMPAFRNAVLPVFLLALAAATAARPKEAWAGGEPRVGKPDAAAAKKASALITISKETTRITGPLRADGYVDYVAALNQRFRQGVTPENNAAVPFLRAMGPAEIALTFRGEYCRMLEIAPLPDQGDYFVTLFRYAQGLKDAEQPAGRGTQGQDILYDQLSQAMRRPWSEKEFPVLAGWLAANEKPLALVLEASKRPRRYDPLISGEDGAVIAILLPAVQSYREAARALTARAMLRAAEGKVEEAWADLLACHRLARLAAQGPTLVENVVGIAVDGMACAGDEGLLQHVRLTAAQAAKMRDSLAALPRMPKMIYRIDVGDRFVFLDGAGMVARQGFSSLAKFTDALGIRRVDEGLDSAARTAVDWDQVLRLGNSWYDRMVDAYGKPTRAERQAALSQLEQDIRAMEKATKEEMAKAAGDRKSPTSALLSGPRDAVSRRVGQVLLCLLLPAVSAASNAEDRGTMQFELTRLAFALAAYRADHGAYPARLADLAPKYVAEVPKDIFSALELHYQQQGNGYLLYSVGVNGKDDGGKTQGDRKQGEDGDDLAVRVPAAAR